MFSPRRPVRTPLRLERLEGRDVPAALTPAEAFNQTLVGDLPAGWVQWATAGSTPFAVSPDRPYSGPGGLAITGNSRITARAWVDQPTAADSGARATVLVDSLEPVEVIARGHDLGGTRPTYYAVTVARGLDVQLVRVVEGQATVLARLRSANYVSGHWLRVTLRPQGDQLSAEVYDPANDSYLNADGQWQSAPTDALTATDATIPDAGQAGLGRPVIYAGTNYVDDFAITGPDAAESFDFTAAGALPAGWSQWASDRTASFGVTAGQGLTTSVSDRRDVITWLNQPLGPDGQVSATVAPESTMPAVLFFRGSDLFSGTPSYYAVSVTKGLTVTLTRVLDGHAQTLGQVAATDAAGALPVRVTLTAHGDTLSVRITQTDTDQSLGADGQWALDPVDALSIRDGALPAGDFAGFIRLASRPGIVGNVNYDDFQASATPGDAQPPTVTITAPPPGTPVGGTVTVRADAGDNVGVTRVEFWVGSSLRAVRTGAPASWDLDTTTLADGDYTLTVKAYDAAGNVGTSQLPLLVQNDGPQNSGPPDDGPHNDGGGSASGPLAVPRHYDHIRIAMLAWAGTPFTDVERNLLRNSVDLVLSGGDVLGPINGVAPATPQLIYTNFSNIYGNLLTDWLNYADAHGLGRESIFYHVTQPTSFTGGSASAVPVNWLWSVRSDSADFTSASRDGTGNDVPFGAAGQSLYFGYPDRFRELNFTLARNAAAGWGGVFEYATATDSAGNPTAWKPLTLVDDSTNGLRQSGTVHFDPPADWVPARLGGSAAYYYVRVRTVTDGTAPVASTILGRNYVNATPIVNGSSRGTIPVFDAAADRNHDGYLSDAEYARRESGDDARFLSESRLFYPYYGPMRFATNPSGAGVAAWAADFAARFLDSTPLAAGLFIDNSGGRSPTDGTATVESVASYTADYAALLGGVRRAVAPRWLMANTAALYPETDAVMQQVQANWQEFGLRPLATGWAQFEDFAATIAHRQSLTDPAPLTVLDSLPTSPTPGVGSPTDPTGRTQLATLAEYYLLGNPQTTFLMFNGGLEPSSSWARHWSEAVKFDVGQPQGDWSEFATGADPANAALTYKVYQRSYTNALVLYKPLSYRVGVDTGTAANNTATTHALGGTYRPLRADGTLGAPVTNVTLRNGEGAILVKV